MDLKENYHLTQEESLFSHLTIQCFTEFNKKCINGLNFFNVLLKLLKRRLPQYSLKAYTTIQPIS